MVDRRPGTSWESHVDRLIREAEERGEFDDLPGKGKPIPGIDRPADDLWWVKRKLEREGLSFTPPTLQLRRDVEVAHERIAAANSEVEVRRIVAEINERIVEVNTRPAGGPRSNVAPLGVDRVLRTWREQP